jgi:hypothetical protein
MNERIDLKEYIARNAENMVPIGRLCFAGLALTTGGFAYFIADAVLAEFIDADNWRLYASIGIALCTAYLIDDKLYEGFTSAIGAMHCPEYEQAPSSLKWTARIFMGMHVGRLALSLFFTAVFTFLTGDISQPPPVQNTAAKTAEKATKEANAAHAKALASADAFLDAERKRAKAVRDNALAAFPADQREAWEQGKWTSHSLRAAIAAAEKKAQGIEDSAAKEQARRIEAADAALERAGALASVTVGSEIKQADTQTKRAARIGIFTSLGIGIIDLVFFLFGTVSALVVGRAYGPKVAEFFPKHPGMADVIKTAIGSVYNSLVAGTSFAFAHVQLQAATLMLSSAKTTAQGVRKMREAESELADAQQGRGGTATAAKKAQQQSATARNSSPQQSATGAQQSATGAQQSATGAQQERNTFAGDGAQQWGGSGGSTNVAGQPGNDSAPPLPDGAEEKEALRGGATGGATPQHRNTATPQQERNTLPEKAQQPATPGAEKAQQRAELERKLADAKRERDSLGSVARMYAARGSAGAEAKAEEYMQARKKVERLKKQIAELG